MEIDWDAPMSEIAVSLGSMKLGMQHIQLRGTVGDAAQLYGQRYMDVSENRGFSPQIIPF